MSTKAINLIPMHMDGATSFGAGSPKNNIGVRMFNYALFRTLVQVAEVDAQATVMAKPDEATDFEAARTYIDEFVPAERRPIAEYKLFGRSLDVAWWLGSDGQIVGAHIGVGPGKMTFGVGSQEGTAPVLMRFIQKNPSERIASLPVGLFVAHDATLNNAQRSAMYNLLTAQSEFETMRQSALQYLGIFDYQQAAESVRAECHSELTRMMDAAGDFDDYLREPVSDNWSAILAGPALVYGFGGSGQGEDHYSVMVASQRSVTLLKGTEESSETIGRVNMVRATVPAQFRIEQTGMEIVVGEDQSIDEVWPGSGV